jgi:hypothetical protein
MAEKSSSPNVLELAALPENEFLELCRDSARIDSEYAFKAAGIDALGAGGYGALATIGAFSGSPYAALGTVVGAVFAGVSLWKGIQAVGEGVQIASQSASADTILHVLYPQESPGTVVKEAESPGRVAPAITPGIRM